MTSASATEPLDLPDGIEIITAGGGLPAVRVDTRACRALVYLHGAHVTHWQPRDQDEVLWLSESAVFKEGKAIRGGVPICAPWFGPGLTGDRKPAHGWFRTSPWTLDAAAVGSTGAATLTFGLDGASAPVPQGASRAVRASYVVTVDEQALDLQLRVEATDEPLVLEEALHAYLRVGSVGDAVITGLDGVAYHDKVTGQDHTQSGSLGIAGETDRVFSHHGNVDLTDQGTGRRIHVVAEQAGSVIVWNPWVDKAAEMADFDDEGWQQMVCVEAGNVLGQAVRLEAGQAHTMRARYELG